MPWQTSRSLLFAAFVLSGLTGLIYESMWTHYLKLYLGHAAFAQSLVLAIFMGGMALGGWLSSVFGPRFHNLLRAYAVAEALIGLYALAFHPLFQALESWSTGSVIPALASPAAVDLLQWGIALLLLLPPSVLLGATFPLMSAAVIRRFPGSDGGHLAMLYFSNSIGAAAGALVASFVLIDWLGLPGTLAFAGAINLAVATVTGVLSHQSEPYTAAGPAPEDPRQLPLLFFVAAFVTGAASFIYEVSWIRMLSLVLGSSFHAFELMLSAFITGLALGALAIRRRIDSIADPLRAAAWIQLAMGLMAVLTLPVYAQSFDWMAALVKSLPKNDAGWTWFNLASHGIAFAVMLPATFLAGMTLPLFTHVLLRNGHGERSIGRVYTANSIGAITGVLLAVHVGLPQAGLQLTLAMGALLDLALGLLLLRRTAAGRMAWLAASAMLLVPLVLVRTVQLDPATLGSGVYRTGDAHPEISRSIFYRDGKTATIAVTAYQGSVGVISTNGKPDAAIEMNPQRPPAPDEITMVLVAALPLAMKPDAQQIANIGFGSGLTTHVALASPRVREVSTIEIEAAVIDASRAFGPRVARAYEDPRSKIYVEDAKSWFARRPQRYDIIVSEPSNPWVSGVASLFSDEFYRRIKRHLAPGGLLVQWLHLYEFDTRLAASVIKAMAANFDDYVVYNLDDVNLMLIAAESGRVPTPGPQMLQEPLMRAELARVGVRTLDDLRLRWLGSGAELGQLVDRVDAPANSDYQPYLEQHAPKARFLRSKALDLPSVSWSTLPIVEMLAREGNAWTASALTPGPGARLTQVTQALAIRAALLGQGAPGAPPQGLQDNLSHLGDCQALGSAAGEGALHELAMATLAPLDASALVPLWRELVWLPCPRGSWPAAAGRQLALYAAVAARDSAAMAQAAEALLAAPGGSPAVRRWALSAALLAQRAQGRPGAVKTLWRQHAPDLYRDIALPTDLRLLLATP